jgi:hypothetical protein
MPGSSPGMTVRDYEAWYNSALFETLSRPLARVSVPVHFRDPVHLQQIRKCSIEAHSKRLLLDIQKYAMAPL